VLKTLDIEFGLSRHLYVRQITAGAGERQDTPARLRADFLIQPSASEIAFLWTLAETNGMRLP
jgi:hypothetical protein